MVVLIIPEGLESAMAKNTTILETKTCNTVGDLLDELAAIAKDPELSYILDSSIDGSGGETYTGFKIIRRTLSDKSTVLDFELFED